MLCVRNEQESGEQTKSELYMYLKSGEQTTREAPVLWETGEQMRELYQVVMKSLQTTRDFKRGTCVMKYVNCIRLL